MSEESVKLKETVQDLLKDAQAQDIEIRTLSRAKAALQVELAGLKDRNKTLELAAVQDATIRRALLLMIGVLKHDVSALHRLGSDEELPSEQFTEEAMRVIEKLHEAFQLTGLPLLTETPVTGVVAKLNGEHKEDADAKSA